MNVNNITVDDLDIINTRKIHELTIIQDTIGTTIHSDEWRDYTSLRNNAAYIHLNVNHSINFVDPTIHVHTQNIENTWMRIKRKQKKQGGMCRTLLSIYLEEFMWRQDFSDKPFRNLVSQISVIYPVAYFFFLKGPPEMPLRCTSWCHCR
jgi:hypothetical protein